MVLILTYTNNWESYIEIAIHLNLIHISDIVTISKTSKTLNSFTKPFIKKYVERLYDILQKCKKVNIITNICSKYSIYQDPTQFYYKNDYWYKIFYKKLDLNELAIYYAYFIKKYIYHTRQEMENEFWMAHIFEDGFIKMFPSIEDGCLIFSGNDVNEYYDRCITSKTYYKYTIFYDYTKILPRNITEGPYYKSIIEINNESLSPVNKKLFEKIIILFKNSSKEYIDTMTYEMFNNYMNN